MNTKGGIEDIETGSYVIYHGRKQSRGASNFPQVMRGADVDIEPRPSCAVLTMHETNRALSI